MSRLVRLCFVALSIVCLAASPAFAAKGGKHAAPTAVAAAVVAPITVPAGEVFQVSADGLDPALPVYVRFVTPAAVSLVTGGFPIDGTVTVDWVQWTPGDIQVTFLADTSGGTGDERLLVEVASATVTVA